MEQIYKQQFTQFIESDICAGKTKKLTDANQMLDVTRFFVHMTRSALKAFTKHKWDKFDALVGDTACQIRAENIAELAKKNERNPKFQAEMKEYLNRFDSFNPTLNTNKEVMPNDFLKSYKGITYSQFCEKLKVDFTFSDDIRFIVESYLLNAAKGETEDPEAFYCNKETVNYQNFEKKCLKYQNKTLSKGLMKKIVEASQRDLSQASVQYLLNKVEKWFDEKEKAAMKDNMIHLSVVDEMGRKCSPCYYNMQIVFGEILKNDLPFYVHVCRWTEDGKYVDSLRFLFKTSNDQKQFELFNGLISDHAPVLVLHGVSVANDNATMSKEDFVKKFNEHSVMDILNANFAQHKQFPKRKNKEMSLPNDPKRENYLHYANEWGCSHDNKSLFLAVHMFCDTYKKAQERDMLV